MKLDFEIERLCDAGGKIIDNNLIIEYIKMTLLGV